MNAAFKSVSLSIVGAVVAVAGATAQSSLHMEKISTVPFAPCSVGDIWAMGDTMLVARRWAGFSLVDVSDPANPVSTDVTPPGYPVFQSSYGVGDIKSDGRYVYATDEATGEGLFIYDAQDPKNPVLVSTLGRIGFRSSCHNCWVDVEAKTLYTTTGDVYDVSNPASPRWLSRIASGHDVVVINGRAYVSEWSSGIGIYDVSTPMVPRRIGSQNYSNSATHNMWPSKDGRHLFTTDENLVGSTGGSVRVWDISNLSSMTQVGSYKTGATGSVVHNVHVHGDLLYVSYYKEGVRVVDISNPATPVEIAHFDTFVGNGGGCFLAQNGWGAEYAGIWGVYPFGLDKVLVSDMEQGAHILRLRVIDQTFSVTPSPVQPGTALQLNLSYQNVSSTPLPGFGIALLSGINGVPAALPLIIDLANVAPSQTVNKTLNIPVPLGLPSGLTIDFTGFSGLSSPLTVTETIPVQVTVQ